MIDESCAQTLLLDRLLAMHYSNADLKKSVKKYKSVSIVLSTVQEKNCVIYFIMKLYHISNDL